MSGKSDETNFLPDSSLSRETEPMAFSCAGAALNHSEAPPNYQYPEFSSQKSEGASTLVRRGASQCGAKSIVFNPSLGLKRVILSYLSHLSHTRLHTTSEDDQMRRHKKHKQQTNTITMMVELLAPPAAWI